MRTKFWAIGDVHLSFAKPRDLTKFSTAWADHTERLASHWRAQVQPEDVVLLLGDTCWTSSVNHARQDLAWLAQLPGRKVLVRGNHDRWWIDINRVRRGILPPNFQAIQGDTLEIDGVLLAGAQGHYAPHDPYYKPDPPQNRYERELKTLKEACRAVTKARQPGQTLIMMLHYPPYTSDGQPTAYSDLVEELAPALCVYGHLHKPSEWAVAVNGETRNGIYYRLVAADYVEMKLQLVFPMDEN